MDLDINMILNWNLEENFWWKQFSPLEETNLYIAQIMQMSMLGFGGGGGDFQHDV